MRIAYVLKKFPRLSETFILNEILGLERLGHEVVVFSLRTPDAEPRHAALNDLKAKVIVIPRRSAKLTADQSHTARTYVSLLPEDRRARIIGQAQIVRDLCSEHAIDHVHAHFMTVASHVSALCRLFGGPPVTVTAHAKDIFRHGINEDLFRATYSVLSDLVTVSNFNRRFIKERFFDGHPIKIATVYNGLDLSTLQWCQQSKDRNQDLVLGVGRLVEKKGFDSFIRIAKRIHQVRPQTEFKIIGGGEDEDKLKQLAFDLEAYRYVEFLGPLPREEVLLWMSKSRVLLAPCQEGHDGNRDALPTVLIEALACGLPCVSTRMVGIPEIVQNNETGLLCEPGYEEGLQDAVLSLLEDQHLWKNCHKNSPEVARSKFDRDRTIQALEFVFESNQKSRAHEGCQ